MIKEIAVILIILLLAGTSLAEESDLPAWLKQKSVHEKVVRFEFEGKSYFFITSRFKDTAPRIYDSDGSFVCSPWKGMTGRKNETCSPLYEKSKDGTVIWDGRKK